MAAAAALIAAAACPAAGQDSSKRESPSDGAAVYASHCAICHGPEGRGDGEAADRFTAAPRNFVDGVYRFRSTSSGKLPTDDDLRRSVVQGLGGTAMVPQNHLSEAEVEAVIAYIKDLSPRFAKEGPPKAMKLPARSPKTDRSLQRGREVYLEAGCANCHGERGAGDGASAPDLSIAPTNLTRHPLNVGSTAEDIVRAVVTGLNGSPMPSYHLLYDDPDMWALGYYVESLGTDQGMTEQARIGWEIEGRDPPGKNDD